ncbi:MAG: hypothetical protein QOK09_1726 [Mycobacterium sp.]|nr:hypothetical protein [Mycobacterium sp.]
MTDIERPKGSTNHPLIPLSDENIAVAEDMDVNPATPPASEASQRIPCMSPAAAEEYITSLYATILKRDPRPDEFANWVANAAAVPPEQVYFAFVKSKEYKLQQEQSVPTTAMDQSALGPAAIQTFAALLDDKDGRKIFIEAEARKNEEVAQLKHDCEALLMRARAQDLRIGTLVAENNSFRQVLSDVQSAHYELKLQAQKRAPLLQELEARKNEEVIIRRERKGLRIAYVTVVRNEQERIHHQLNYYYLIGIRDFFLCDHGSTDGTAALIERFRLENPDANVVCIFDPTPGHYQGVRMTVLADLAYSYGCDWILALDADEILLSRDGLPDLKAFIAHEELRNKQYGHVLLPLVNYLPTTKDPVKESNPFLRLKFRENDDCQAEIWWPPKVFAKWRRGMFIGEGNHEIIGLTERIDLLENPLYLAHFPYSTMDQVVAKVVKGGRSFEQAPEFGPLIGWHWKEAYEQYQLKGEQAIYDWFDGWHRDAGQLSFHPLEAAWFKPARQKSTLPDQNFVESANVLNCAPSANLR